MTRPFNRYRRVRPKLNFAALFKFFYFCLCVVGMYFIVFNVAPYYEMMVRLNQLILNIETKAEWEKIIVALVAFTFWAIIQLIELFPLLMMRNSTFLKRIIDKANAITKYKVEADDNATVKSMKLAYNNLPVSFLRDLRVACVVTYVVDFLINSFVNPPIKGGANSAWRIVFGRWDLIDWGNIYINVQTVLAVEAVVIGLLWTGILIQAFRHE
ncbi:hypothetical protein NIES4101_53980 [Calothrix sp. NIES-4101]|nr:hypothetical protein NIES4101_53980 [Calothrix sp. NIES-4101]